MRVALATVTLPGSDLVGALERSQTEVTVVRRAEDLAELLAVVRSGLVDAVLVAAGVDTLTLAFLEEAARAPRPVGVLALSEVRAERSRLRGIGIPCLRTDAEPREVARAVQDVARAAAQGVPPALGPGEEEPDGIEAFVAGAAPDPRTPLDPADVDVETGVVADGAAADDPWSGRGEPLPESAFGPGWAAGESETAADGDAGGPSLPAVGRAARDEGTAASEAGTAVPDDSAPGRVLAVWGPTGAPGRTTVAVNLAAELALAGLRTLVVDLDTYGPSVGVHLGLADESAGVSRASRRADRERLRVADLLEAAVRVRVAGAEVDVLTGLTRPERWPEVRPSAVERILETAREHWERVVVDVGFSLEEDEELSFDIPAPQRNGATLAALRAADRVLAVGTADAVGLPRLIRGVEALTAAAAGTPVSVVVNRTRAAASGLTPQAQVAAVWARYGPAEPVVAFLPWDPAAADRALLGGQVLAEAAPSSALRRALTALARSEGASPADPAAGRRQRRAARAAAADGSGPVGEAGGRGTGRRLTPWPALSRRTR